MVYNTGFLFGFLRNSRITLESAGSELYVAANVVLHSVPKAPPSSATARRIARHTHSDIAFRMQVRLLTASDCVHVVVVPVLHVDDARRRVYVADDSFTSVMVFNSSSKRCPLYGARSVAFV